MRKRLRMWGALFTTAFLLAFGGKAQAVIGIPDDVPAATLLFPFFKVNPTQSGLNHQDTLIAITNTANPGSNVIVHITLWNVRSQHVFDFNITLTPHDVFSCSLLDLLVNPTNQAKPCGVFQAPTGIAEQLRSGNILAGYITADVVSQATAIFPGQAGYPFRDWNILVGHAYLVDLPAGSATGFNAVSIEAEVFPNGSTYNALSGGLGHPAVAADEDAQIGFYLNRCIEEQGASANCAPAGVYGNRERIDGFSGDVVQTFDRFGYPPANRFGDSPLSLIVRYFSESTLGGRTEVWLWKDRVTSGTAANVNLAVYDEAENSHSISLSLPDEVNFTPTAQIVTPGVPGGWFRIRFACGQFGYCGYDPNSPATWGTPTTPIQAVAYSLQFANSQNASLRWDAAFPAHRQYTTYIGGPSAE
ncbi:MAG: hypothetical protein FJ147_24960 [Deltaproteobacteria bacterium]|nr:hypothetical protein [Deltaproteobacteria bacterium]